MISRQILCSYHTYSYPLHNSPHAIVLLTVGEASCFGVQEEALLSHSLIPK